MRCPDRQRRIFENLRDVDRNRDDEKTGERGRCADFGDEKIMPGFDDPPPSLRR